MQSNEVAKFGYYADIKFSTDINFNERIIKYIISDKSNSHIQIAIMLADYLIEHSKNYDKVAFHFTNQTSGQFRNGSLVGLVGLVNGSKIDVAIQPFVVDEFYLDKVDYSYPFKLFQHTFMTKEPEYKPHIFGIFQTLSLSI